MTASALADSLSHLLRIVETLERNHKYLNLNAKCEPQPGRRGLYRQTGGTDNSSFEEAMLWMLNLSDGDHSVLDIAERSKLGFSELAEVAACWRSTTFCEGWYDEVAQIVEPM